ncbi:MAG: HYR domain-containing protein, partial [Candidatus Didemnitutus sp.]|nr:HYR domain-containing protein [Candidatus Didemnitutus sp.]
GVTDNCPGATVTTLPASGSVFAKGDTTVRVIATDAAGNTTESSFTVSVADHEAPQVFVPADLTVGTDAGQCSATVALDYRATDNCPGVTVSSSWTGGAFPKGTTVVTVTATDAAGNTAAQSFSVTVIDNEAPVLTIPSNITVATAPGLCAASVPFTFSATDNCPDVTVSADWTGGMFPKGTTTVTVTATDASGNITTGSFTVTVVDRESPTINCPSDLVAYAAGVTSLALNPGTATYADNCGATLSTTRSDGQPLDAAFPVGTTVVRWIATDDAGNTAWCEQKIVVANTLGAGGGHTMGFWSNKNGQSVFNSFNGTAAMLNAMNLRSANGSPFDLPVTAAGLNTSTSFSTLSSWLNATSATNMAYMLSGQLAAMKLNVHFAGTTALAKFGTGVNGHAYIHAPGAQSANAWGITTVNALIAEANAALGANGLTLSGSAARDYQTALKTALDRGNNNLNFVIVPN